MAEEEKKELPPQIQSFLRLVQENISLYPETVVYNRIKDHIPLMTTRQVAWLTSTIIISTEFRVRIFKHRCDTGDDLACDMLGLTINGDPYSKNLIVKKGLMGLWNEDHDIEAAKLLVEIGQLSQKDLDQTLKTGKDKEMIAGRTREDALCELAIEAREYKSGDEFSMAMIMGRLKSVPEPNTANVRKIIQGKYKSGEEFWMGVHNGDLDETCKRVKEEKEIIQTAKRKEIIKPEISIPQRPLTTPMEPMPMEELKRVVQPVKEKEKEKEKETDLNKRIDELRKKKEKEKKEREEREWQKVPRPEPKPEREPVTQLPEQRPELDLMHEEARRRINEEMEKIRLKRSAGEGQAGEPASRYSADKKKVLKTKKPKRDIILDINGIEKTFSYDKWIEYPVRLKIDKDAQMMFVSYDRKYQYETEYNRVLSYGSFIQFSSINYDRFQVAKGYQIDIHIKTNRFDNPVTLVISVVPEGTDLYGVYIYENSQRQVANFEITGIDYNKVELLAKQPSVIREVIREVIRDPGKMTKKFIVLWNTETQSKTFDTLTDASKYTKELRKQGNEDAYFKHSTVENLQTCVVCKKKFVAIDEDHLINKEYICSAPCYKKKKGGSGA